jgi:PAS domain S-box-containing protein
MGSLVDTDDELEQGRIAAVKSLNILDTEPESAFDEAVNLAAVICGTPISLITLLDGKRQWFKAKVGLAVSETPQEQAFCAHAIRGRELFVVNDALSDSRFQNNPLVTGDPHIRFYAGMPLQTPEGHALGTLCVIDTVPRELTGQQKTALAMLSRQVFGHMRLRNQMRGLRQLIEENAGIGNNRIGRDALFQAFMDHSPLVAYIKDEHGRLIYYNQLFADRFGITRDAWLNKDDFEIWPQQVAARYRAIDCGVLETGESSVCEESSPGPAETTVRWRSYKFRFIDAAGERLLAGVSLDVSNAKSTGTALESDSQAAA